MWKAGAREESLEVLRRHLLIDASTARVWATYGTRLLENHRPDAALEAFKSALDLEPAHREALELYEELLHHHSSQPLTALAPYVKRALDRAIVVPAKQRSVLDLAIHHDEGAWFSQVTNSPDSTVREVARHYLAWRNSGNLTPGPQVRPITSAVWHLARGDSAAAVAALQALPNDALPVRDIRLAARRALRNGEAGASVALLRQYLRARPQDKWAMGKVAELAVETVAEGGSKRSFPIPSRAPSAAYRPADLVVYTAYNSLPFHSAGYAVRTAGLLRALAERGLVIEAVTRLGYPFDMPGFAELDRVPLTEQIGGVKYRRLNSERHVVPRSPSVTYMTEYSDSLVTLFRELRPKLIHAASNHVNGLASIRAARIVGIPSIYEVRGLWEVTRASRDREWAESDEYRHLQSLEAQAANEADRVFTITAAVRDEMIRRGVAADKISVLPNGVDIDEFVPRPRNELLATKLGFGELPVIGYIGSLLDYEGLDLLLYACADLWRVRQDFRILIVGDGPILNELERLAWTLGLHDAIHFAGRVPHSDVADYYSLVDVAPFPRHGLPVCQLVSPLKPFEAMAMGKAVVVSDVAALTEIVEDGVTGRIHRWGSSTSLTTVLADLLDHPGSRAELAAAGRKWVERERTWTQIVSRVESTYQELTQ